MNMASERVTICQKKIDELMKNKSIIDKEITQIQFNATRLKETKIPVMQVSESKENLEKLNLTLSDLIKRKDMVFNIVNDIYKQSDMSLTDAKSKYQREIDLDHLKLQEYENTHKDLINALHSVEQQLRDEVGRIDLQLQELENQNDPSADATIQISQMKKLIFEIDKEIESLLVQQKQNHEADQQRQEFYQTQVRRLNKIAKDREENFSSYQVTINTQKMEIKKLQSKLEVQLQKNEELVTGIEKIQSGYQKPDFKQLYFETKEKLNKKFAHCTEVKAKKFNKLKKSVQNIKLQIKNQEKVNNNLKNGIDEINKSYNETSRLINEIRKKSKLLSMELKSLESEREILTKDKNEDEIHIDIPLPELPEIPEIPEVSSDNSSHFSSRPGPRPPPLQIPSPVQSNQKIKKQQKMAKNDNLAKIQQDQVVELTGKMNDASIEMQQLTEKQNKINNEIVQLRIQNNQLRKETASYDEIKRYYISLTKSNRNLIKK